LDLLGFSPTQTIFSSGSYATMVDVPNCSKLYTSDSFDFSGDVFDACTHTTLAIFPGRPKPNEGSIIISSEIGNPMKPWTVWGGAQPFTVYNTELDSSIAVLHYQLIIDENTDTYWDGTFKGNKVADGLHTYKLIYNTRILTGTVHLFK
jgi:hypothetical protein